MTMSGDKAPRRGERGFSLMEAVVAIAVIGVLSLVVVEVARLSRTGYERSLAASETYRGAEATRRVVSQLLAQIEPLVLEDQEGDRAVFFDGAQRRLTFLSPYAALAAPGSRAAEALARRPGLTVVSIGLEPAESGGDALVLRHAPLSAKEAPEQEGSMILLPAPVEFNARYFGPERDDEPEQTRWQELWRLRAALPRAVSIAIEGPGSSRSAPIVLKLGRNAEEDAF